MLTMLDILFGIFSTYNSNSNQAISGSKSSFSCSPGISSSSQLNSSSDPSTSIKEFSNPSHHISARVKSERSDSPVITSHNFDTSSALHKLVSSVNQIQTKAALKAIVSNPSVAGAVSLNSNSAQGRGQSHAATIHENIVIQSSPISFSMLENHVAYSGSNNSHSASNTSRNASSMRKQEFQHDSASSIPNTNSNLASNSNPNSNQKHQLVNNCSHIVIPRRPSPQQIASQPSPLSAVPSPAYPTFNSPMNPSPSPIDASISRTSSKTNQVAYSSVIQRAALPSSNWNEQSSPQAQTYNQTPAQITKLHQVSPVQYDSQHSNRYENAQSTSQHNQNSQITAHKQTNMVHEFPNQTSIPFELNQNQNQRQRQTIQTDSIKKDEYKTRPGRKKKISDRTDSEKPPSPYNSSEYYTNANERVPPPAHVSHQQSNGSLNSNLNAIHNHTHNFSHSRAMISHPSHHHNLSHPYFPSYSMPLGIGDYSNDLNLNSMSNSLVANNPYNDSLGTPSVSSNYSPTTSEIREDEQPKVVVPNIEEELGFLAENNRSGSMQQTTSQLQHQASTQNHLTLLGTANNIPSHHNPAGQQQAHLQHASHTNQNANNSQSSSSNQQMSQQKTPLTDKKFPTPTGPGSGFMQSYLKFLQGERDSTSPPPVNRSSGGGRKTWSRTANQAVPQVSPSSINQTSKNQMSNGMNNMMGTYDRKRNAGSIIDDDEDTSDSLTSKQTVNKNSKKQSQQSIVERAPQFPINAAKKARTAQTSHTSQQSIQQNNPHSLQQNPQLLMQQHASPAHQLVAGTSQILSQQQMYYPQDEGTSTFSSYFDYLRRQKW